jgi:putative peptide zinc metalloprotease protein
LGSIAPVGTWRFSAVVTQSQASELFQEQIRSARVRLRGEAQHAITVTKLQSVPGEQQNLPAAALGWTYGGPIQTDPSDSKSLKALNPFFLVYAELQPNAQVTLVHHRCGRLRLALPAQPLLLQAIHELRKLLQSRLSV